MIEAQIQDMYNTRIERISITKSTSTGVSLSHYNFVNLLNFFNLGYKCQDAAETSNIQITTAYLEVMNREVFQSYQAIAQNKLLISTSKNISLFDSDLNPVMQVAKAAGLFNFNTILSS